MIRSGRCAAGTMLVAAITAIGVNPASGQWRIDAQAGRLRYDAAPDAVTTSVAIGLSRLTSSSTFGISAGIPFTREEPVWGALQGSHRFASSGSVRFGVDLAADAFGYHLSVPDSGRLPLFGDGGEASITGWGLAAEVMPLVAWDGPVLSAQLRAGATGFTASASDIEAYDRATFVTDLALAPPDWHGLSARVDARWVSASEGGFPFAGLSLAWSGPATVWGSVGQWFDDAAESPSWEAGASVPLGSRVAILVSGHHEEIDPIYATPARTTWGAGVRVLLGDVARSLPEPVPSAYVDGIATIALLTDDVEGVPSIAGDFNEWTPTPMTRDEATDTWVLRVPLTPGVYNYAFVDGEGNWFVPEETPGRHADGMGGYVAVIVVEE